MTTPVDQAPKRGRPSEYSQEVADEICQRMIEGESLRSICREDRFPTEGAVRMWAVKDVQGFHSQYTRAREAQMDAMGEDVLEIADDARNDWMERHGENDAGWVVNGEHVQRSRLRLDTRKWLMSKIAPKRFGDRLAHEHTGKDGGPIETMTRIELVAPGVPEPEAGE